MVSSVFHNRLKKYETTIRPYNFICKKFDKKIKKKVIKFIKKDLQSDNPWNTYTRKGMPISPICNPGIDAIKAAANPYLTDFLFFVSDGKGGHRFSITLQEHMKNIKLWKRKKNEKNKINRLGIMLVISISFRCRKNYFSKKTIGTRQ